MSNNINGFLWTAKSFNRKTGAMPVTTTDMSSCPSTCELRGNGCYAEHGPLGQIWRGLTAAGPRASFANGRGTVSTVGLSDVLDRIAQLPNGTIWRDNQAGDQPHHGGAIDVDVLRAKTKANRGKRGYTYTHHQVEHSPHNRDAIADAVREGFTINLSARDMAQADRLKRLAIAPVVVVLPIDAELERTFTTPDGNKGVVCPVTQKIVDGISGKRVDRLPDLDCQTCGLCAVSDRKSIVGFPAHGAAKRKAQSTTEVI